MKNNDKNIIAGVTGATLGASGSIGTVAASGAVVGLGATGTTSGLATVGTVILIDQ
jgi:hypothetical protein